MDPFELEWKHSAAKELRKLDKQIIEQVLEAAGELVSEPHPIGSKKLHGSDHIYRIRIGDYRVVYEVDAVSRIITIIRVRHRKDVYR
ncbi:MAG: type II toxin-antitoxin system RelE/ParE family toxin [Anaerolineae bacterium]|nr:type II toxin-antitoxin system RelE/ParE family toxin [Anaerolineae bacterium]